MGNCQAIDAATLVIQHPNGKTERFYSPVTATHVMKTNPGHYVALIISTTTTLSSSSSSCSKTNNNNNKDSNSIENCTKKIENKNKDNSINPVRITRIKLLKPTDTLQLGQVYRLITTQEVMKGLKERKKSKMKQQSMSESAHKEDCVKENFGLEMEKAAKSDSEDNLVTKHERHRTRTTTAIASSNNNNGGSVITAKTRFWQPSLQSISESAS